MRAARCCGMIGALNRANSPTPALVTQRAAQRLPRLALLLFCAAYVLPGAVRPRSVDERRRHRVRLDACDSPRAGRRGSPRRSAACRPTAPLLPYWLGALFIRLLSPLDRPGAGRADPVRAAAGARAGADLVRDVPPGAHRSGAAGAPSPSAARPTPVDYARAIADGALLALIASLGLLQLGHETTPELVQLVAVALVSVGVRRRAVSRLAARRLATLVGCRCWRPAARRRSPSCFGAARRRDQRPIRLRRGAARSHRVGRARPRAAARAAGDRAGRLGLALGARRPRCAGAADSRASGSWFIWPAWPLALWTLWRWRRQLPNRHISVPLALVARVDRGCILRWAASTAR